MRFESFIKKNKLSNYNFLIFLIFKILLSACSSDLILNGGEPLIEVTENNSKLEGQIKYSFMVVHCDPVTGVEQFNHDFSLLKDLVETSNQYGFKLSIHFTLSFALYAKSQDKTETIKSWLMSGHVFGTHSHPEWNDGDSGTIMDLGWINLPTDKVKQSIDDATNAVNELVGKENNKILDTLAFFFEDAGSAAQLIPDQYSIIANGNNGYPFQVPIYLEDDREIKAYFYRTIPGFFDGDPEDVMTANELIREATYFKGELLAPVIHPTNFGPGFIKEETIKWMKWVEKNMISLDPLSISVEENYKNDQKDIFLTSKVYMEDNNKQKIEIKAFTFKERENIEIVSFLASGVHELDLSSVKPTSFVYDKSWGRITWVNQKLESNVETIYSYEAKRTNDLEREWHPTSLIVHSFLYTEENSGEMRSVMKRWSMDNEVGTITRAQGSRIGGFDSLAYKK